MDLEVRLVKTSFYLAFLNPKNCPERKIIDDMHVEIPQNMYVALYAPVTSLKKPAKIRTLLHKKNTHWSAEVKCKFTSVRTGQN